MPESENGRDALLWGIIILSTLILTLAMLYGTSKDYNPTYGLVFLVIFGVIEIITVLTIASKTYVKTRLACKEEALGLPSGSIRALIALGLIIIFAIMAIFMYNQLTPTGLLVNIPANQTVILANGTVINGNPYGIGIMTEPSQAMRDFSTQVITTVSTLVVALAGFYFGTKAATSGKNESEEKETEYGLTITSKGNVQKGKPISFKVETKPKDENVKLLSVEGDKRQAFNLDSLKTTNEIIYTPSDDHTNIVTAIFALTSGDTIKTTKNIEIVLEKMTISSKQSLKVKESKPLKFELEVVSESGKMPKITVFGDDGPKIIDDKNIEKGEFTYTPSPKGTHRSGNVILQIELEANPNIVEKPTVEVEP